MNPSIYPDKESLCEGAALQIASLANSAIVEHGRFTVALSGGLTPVQLYQILAAPQWRDKIDWPNWQIFWSDERLVPLDDERSNYHAADSALLSKVGLNADHIQAVPVDSGTPEEIAAAYEHTIRFVMSSDDETIPRFDLILLGLGSDGHTASLFPGQPAIMERERLVVSSPPGTLPPPIDRVTFTLPLINAARNVMVMVAGSDKREALSAVRGQYELAGYGLPPAAQVKPAAGNLIWLVDAAAAGNQ